MPRSREPAPPMTLGDFDDDAAAAIEVARIQRRTARAGKAVAGERNVEPLQHRNGTKSRPRTRQTDGQPVRMTSVHLPTALIVQVNVEAARRETTFSAIVEEALRARLGGAGRAP